MGEYLDAALIFYTMIAAVSAVGLVAHADLTGDGRHHWTRPFAGALWPILAIIGVYMVWVKRND